MTRKGKEGRKEGGEDYEKERKRRREGGVDAEIHRGRYIFERDRRRKGELHISKLIGRQRQKDKKRNKEESGGLGKSEKIGMRETQR